MPRPEPPLPATSSLGGHRQAGPRYLTLGPCDQPHTPPGTGLQGALCARPRGDPCRPGGGSPALWSPEMGRGLAERHPPQGPTEAPHLCSFGEGAVPHQDPFSGQQLLLADLETQPHSSRTPAQPGQVGAGPEAAAVRCPWGGESQSPAPRPWRPEALGPRVCPFHPAGKQTAERPPPTPPGPPTPQDPARPAREAGQLCHPGQHPQGWAEPLGTKEPFTGSSADHKQALLKYLALEPTGAARAADSATATAPGIIWDQ